MKATGLVLAILIAVVAILPLSAAAGDRDCPDYCAEGVTYFRGVYNSRTGSCDYSFRTACDYGCDARGTGCAAAPVTTTAAVTRTCPDTCANGVAYARGNYNSQTGICDYSFRTACDYGCDARGTGCAAAPVTTTAVVRRACPDYCKDGTHYFNGAWNSVMQQCNYMSRTCVHGCDSSQTTCQRDPEGCPEFCRDGFHYFNGSWNDWAQQCDYAYREQCLSGCDTRGTACLQSATTGQAPSERERYITCPADCSCISRQGAVDRWGSAVWTCSNNPCGKTDDGTYLYCIQPSPVTQPLQTPGVAERLIACPSDCSCIIRQEAVDRWGSAVRMCSGDPCGKATDGSYLYCIKPTEQRGATIRERYSSPSEPVIAVNPAVEGEQMIFIVSRERRGMLLGFIPVRMTVNTRLNATDLALLREERPWWAFLATEAAPPAPVPPVPATTPAPT